MRLSDAMAGKLIFTLSCLLACLLSAEFRESLHTQIVLPVVLLAVWYDTKLLKFFKDNPMFSSREDIEERRRLLRLQQAESARQRLDQDPP